jgi:acyl-CoA synthetase (NDP forming)
LKVDFAKLDRAFNPRCIAVVGDSKKGNFHWLRNESDFQGKLYSIQVNPESIEGIKELGVENYTSLLDIPEPVDFVIVNVPREIAPQILEDCIKKKVAAAHFFSSGFAETDTEEGISLERQLTQRAEETGFHIVGPNCRGIYNPRIGLKQIAEQYSGFSGPVGLIMQSGGHAMTFAREARLQQVYINKSVSFGNGIVLHASDYLEYFGRDPGIKAIGMYLEGVKDGRRFFTVLRDVAARKPVVIWKGGWTSDGGRAIASHTGSLAVPQVVWDAALRQCGAVQVWGMEGLIDTIKALLFLSPVLGNRVGVAGGAGGQSIAITDVLAAAGLEVPLLTQESYNELATFFSLIGGSYRNPLDTDAGLNRRELARIFEILAQDANVDILMLLSRVGKFLFSPALQDADIEAVISIRKKTSKPVLAVLPYSTPEEMAEATEVIPRFQDGGVAVFPSMERGAAALRNAFDYYRFRRRAASGSPE